MLEVDFRVEVSVNVYIWNWKSFTILSVSECCNRTSYYLEQTPVCLLEAALSSEAVTAH